MSPPPLLPSSPPSPPTFCPPSFLSTTNTLPLASTQPAVTSAFPSPKPSVASSLETILLFFANTMSICWVVSPIGGKGLVSTCWILHAVSKVAFESVGRLFNEFESKKMSRLAGDKLVDSENSVAIRSNWLFSMVEFVWKTRSSLMSRALILPVESFRSTAFPLVYAVKAVASGSIEAICKLSSKASARDGPASFVSGNAEKFVGVSDVVMHLSPFLESWDPSLIYEVAITMLYLADVPGGKPEWASGSIIAILTLWDRQEFSSARESIVRAVVTNLHLLDLNMQVFSALISVTD